MHSTKGALGMVPKTRDEEHHQRMTALSDVEKAIREYVKSLTNMKSAMEAFSKSFSAVTRAIGGLTTADQLRPVYTEAHQAQQQCETHFLVFERDMEDQSLITQLKNQLKELRKAEAERKQCLADYDLLRDAVSTKEDQYLRKGRDLDGSKYYNEDVKKRDDAKVAFDDADAAFIQMYDTFQEVKVSNCLKSFSSSLKSVALYLTAVSREAASVRKVCKLTRGDGRGGESSMRKDISKMSR